MSPEEQAERDQIATALDMLICITSLSVAPSAERRLLRSVNNQYDCAHPKLLPCLQQRAEREDAA